MLGPARGIRLPALTQAPGRGCLLSAIAASPRRISWLARLPVRRETLLSFAALIVLQQALSLFFPPYLVPGVQDIAGKLLKALSNARAWQATIVLRRALIAAYPAAIECEFPRKRADEGVSYKGLKA